MMLLDALEKDLLFGKKLGKSANSRLYSPSFHGFRWHLCGKKMVPLPMDAAQLGRCSPKVGTFV